MERLDRRKFLKAALLVGAGVGRLVLDHGEIRAAQPPPPVESLLPEVEVEVFNGGKPGEISIIDENLTALKALLSPGRHKITIVTSPDSIPGFIEGQYRNVNYTHNGETVASIIDVSGGRYVLLAVEAVYNQDQGDLASKSIPPTKFERAALWALSDGDDSLRQHYENLQNHFRSQSGTETPIFLDISIPGHPLTGKAPIFPQ